MQLVTSKTYETIRNSYSRRGFLKLAASAGVGVVIYSDFGVTRMCFGQGFGWMGLLEYFGEFALNLGMDYLGFTAEKYLRQTPKLASALKSFTDGLNGHHYRPDYSRQQIGGYGSTFFALESSNNFMLPFFNTDTGRNASPVKWFTGLTMPLVHKALRRDGVDNQGSADYLLPREPKGHTEDDLSLPEEYVTRNGSVNYDFTGDENSGEVKWTVYAQEEASDIEKPLQKGSAAVALHRQS